MYKQIEKNSLKSSKLAKSES